MREYTLLIAFVLLIVGTIGLLINEFILDHYVLAVYLTSLSTGEAITCLSNTSSNPKACVYRLVISRVV